MLPRMKQICDSPFVQRAHFYFCALVFLCGVGLVCGVESGGRKVYSFESIQMGMPFHLMIEGDSDDKESIELIAQKSFHEISRLNNIFSNYEYDSELSVLSRSSGSNQWVSVSSELWSIFDASHKLYDSSGQLFDITIGPASALWRKARREKQMPEERLLHMVQNRVGHENILWDKENRRIQLKQKNMSLDLGGIAKGFALDRVHQLLNSAGYKVHLVRAGGDMVLGKAPSLNKNNGWVVTLFPEQDIPAKLVPFRKVVLSDCAVGTSGDIFQFVEIDGVRYSHIINPKTCIGLTESRRTVVITQTGIKADSYATTACLMGGTKAIKWLHENKIQGHITFNTHGNILSKSTPDFWKNLNQIP